MNYAQTILLKLNACSVLLLGSLFLLFSYRGHIATIWLILAGVFVVFLEIFLAIKIAKAIVRKVLFDTKLRKRLKKINSSLREAGRENSEIHNNLMEGILLIDEQSRIISLNSAAQKILELRQRNDLSLMAAIRAPELDELIAHLREHKEQVEKTITLPGPEEKKLVVRLSLLSSGTILVSLIDTTFSSSVMEKHDDFVAHASHELKTPITIILANAEILMDSGVPSSTKPLLEAILRQANRAKNLLDTLLDLLRFDAGRAVVSLESTDLSRFVDDLKPLIGQCGATITNGVRENSRAFADRRLLERLSLIIIENAQKYAGPRPEIVVKTVDHRNFVSLQFTDGGPGIKPHLRERVFERFFRQPEHDQEKKEGFGLGLAHAKAIAKSMHATIRVDENMRGCTIAVDLPTEIRR